MPDVPVLELDSVSKLFGRVAALREVTAAFAPGRLYGIFGEDRVLYGSDWPNSDQWAPYPKVLGLVRGYFDGKSRAAQEKYFWKNSVAAYRWVKRESGQPKMA